MKVITTSYFSDFARYFCFLEDNFLKQNCNTSFYHVALYPCAYFYYKANARYAEAAFNITSSRVGRFNKEEHDYLLNDLIMFNKKSLEMYGYSQSEKLKDRALIYLNFFDHVFKVNDFDLLISSGDSRLLPSVIIHLAKEYNVKIIYFEQGPFNSTILDRKGVNANIEFKPSLNTIDEVKLNKLNEYLKDENKNNKYWIVNKRTIRDKLNTCITYLYLYKIPIISNFLPTDLQTGVRLKSIIKAYFSKFGRLKVKTEIKIRTQGLTKKKISFFLQVPVDSQLIEHSPFYMCFYEMLTDIKKAIPMNYTLVVREHPHYQGQYDKRIYSLIDESDNIIIDNKIALNEILIESDLCIVNNSTVGVEALMLRKKVFNLGRAYYTHKGVTFDFSGDLNNLKKEIQHAIDAQEDLNKINSFLYEFIFEYLYNGHFQDAELVFHNEAFDLDHFEIDCLEVK